MKTVARRVIPVILHSNGGAVKTERFKEPKFVGDTLNTALIFSELNVDELAVLDIDASAARGGPNLKLVRSLSAFCSMPICYGGGIATTTDAENLFRLGVEKVSVNAALEENPHLVSELARRFGNQAVRVSVDVRIRGTGEANVWFKRTGKSASIGPLEFSRRMQDCGAGEVMLTTVNREGTWGGANLELAADISEKLEIPVIINGGISSMDEIDRVFESTQCSGVGVSSLFLYQKIGSGVLVGVPVVQ
jgi:cyclase